MPTVSVYLRSTAIPAGNDVWLRDPTVDDGGTVNGLTLVAGAWVNNPTAGAGDVKFYLNAGILYGQTAPFGGYVLVRTTSGALTTL